MASSPFQVRRATFRDAGAIAALHVRSWQWAYRGLLPDAYLDGLTASVEQRRQYWVMILGPEGSRNHLTPAQSRGVWVAEWEGEVVGFASAGQSPDDDADARTGHLAVIYLDQGAVGRGVGRALLACAVDDLRRQGFTRATLWVLDVNVRARRFYEAARWVADGTAKTDQHAESVLRQVRYRLDPLP